MAATVVMSALAGLGVVLGTEVNGVVPAAYMVRAGVGSG